MSDITLDQIIQLADQLSEADRVALVKHLQVSTDDPVMKPIPPMPAPKGVPGASLLRFAGMIPADDLEKMATAIEEDCESIDPNGW